MVNKLMYIPNDDTQNYPSVVESVWTINLMSQLLKIQCVPKVVESTNNKTLLINIED